MELTILLTIVGLIIALPTYLRTFSQPPKPNIENDILAFQVKFKLVQSIHLDTQNLLKGFIAKHDCGNEKMMEGFTYSQYLKAMDEAFPNSNSDKVLGNILPKITSKPQIDLLMDEINIQYRALNPIYQQMIHLSKR